MHKPQSSPGDHDRLREQIALAAAGALGPDEFKTLMEHSAGCESCRRELELWGAYSRGLRQLPQPSIPGDLFARTYRRVLEERAASQEHRQHTWMIVALGLLSWASTFVTWIVVRALTGGTLEVLGTNLVEAGPWILFSTLLTWITAGSAAVALGSQRHTRRTQ